MQLTREAKLYPSAKQIVTLEKLLEESRLFYNFCLETKKIAWETEKKNISRYDLQKIGRGKGDLPSSQRQMIIYRLNNAYQHFFKLGGFPRFKKFGRYRSLNLRQYGHDYRIDGKYLMAWKKYGLNGIKTRGLQELNKPSEARIVKRASGWYLQVIDEVLEHPKVEPEKKIGIDLGLRYFVADSEGGKIMPPKSFRKSESLLAIQQRKASKAKKGGQRKVKAYRIVERTHERIANRRRDFLHKTASKYAKNYDLVAIEDLNVKGMIKNRHLSKSISDASWGIFAGMLDYKLKILGKALVKVNPRFTSQKCSQCGEIVRKSLSVRTHICLLCGLILDRDENASRNILTLATVDNGIGEDSANRLVCTTRETPSFGSMSVKLRK